MMNFTLRALSALLCYPDEDLIAALPEIRSHFQAEHAAGNIEIASLARLNTLIDFLGIGDLLDLQENYVGRFDTGRYSSLHLFEHIHGESRDRGQAMVDLRERYAESGLELAINELPDYLPVLLEYLATCDLVEQKELLGDFASIIRLIGQRLAGDESPWAAVFPALLQLAGLPEIDPAISQGSTADPLAREPGSPDDDWQEAPVWGPDPRMVRRIVGGGLNGGSGPRSAPEGLPVRHPLHTN